MTIDLSKYAPVISSDEKADEILDSIKQNLPEAREIILDFSRIRIISTKCAKRILGTLYGELGSEAFFSRIIIMNASENVRPSLSDGIESYLSECKAAEAN